ncbi:hypothetical protein NQ317_012513 [Molorchus minor]|uniref:Cytochrome P450 n=1 Tax=Molorchus minor TaxID=1323400 RepID=A0ABQ9K2Q9_9CUCU|nr:hypothetical protein NQ317_012513 [Molorchus minor]
MDHKLTLTRHRRFTCDNVAVCVFGLEGKSFEESNFEFRELGQFLAPESVQSIKFALTMIVPNLTNLFSVKVIPKEVDDRLIQIVSQTIEYRKSNKIVRNDFMDLVSQLEYSDTQNSLVEIAAHLTAFFIEGFETSSVVMSYALYELARNEDSQEKLRNEIQDVLEKHNGIFSYDALQEMTFLDACLYETLRLHPTSGFQPKTCTERHELESTNPEYAPLSVTIEPGTPIILPVLALHMDPKHYPDPEKFIPERFSKDNNYNYVFLAFGIGPRSCVGMYAFHIKTLKCW